MQAVLYYIEEKLMKYVNVQPNRENMVRNIESLVVGARYKEISGTTSKELATITVEHEPDKEVDGTWYMYVTIFSHSSGLTRRREKMFLSDHGIVPATANGMWNPSFYLVPLV